MFLFRFPKDCHLNAVLEASKEVASIALLDRSCPVIGSTML